MLDPKRAVEREYVATVDGDAMRSDLKEKLAEGVETTMGVFRADLIEQKENFVRLVVTEGKYRMVRRILANIGLPVTSLHRTRYGVISLDEYNIKPGEHAAVSQEGIDWANTLLDKKKKRSERTKQQRTRERIALQRKGPQKTEEGLNPTLSTYSPVHAIKTVLETEKKFTPEFRSYTLKSGEWEFTEQEKADILNESTWTVYDNTYFKPELEEGEEPLLPPGPIEVL